MVVRWAILSASGRGRTTHSGHPLRAGLHSSTSFHRLGRPPAISSSRIGRFSKKSSLVEHGTAKAYANHHCRCDLCRSAWAQWRRSYVQDRQRQGFCIDCTRQAAEGHRRCELHLQARRKPHSQKRCKTGGCSCKDCQTPKPPIQRPFPLHLKERNESIRRLRNEGASVLLLASRFSMTRQNIYHILAKLDI